LTGALLPVPVFGVIVNALVALALTAKASPPAATAVVEHSAMRVRAFLLVRVIRAFLHFFDRIVLNVSPIHAPLARGGMYSSTR
jgi:hypothetical protein